MNVEHTKLALAMIAPKCDAVKWAEPLLTAMDKFNINTAKRKAAFIAQLAHESDEFTKISENLNYSAKRLMEVWPLRFKTHNVAVKYEYNPVDLANKVYANRMGNGGVASGDGWRFRGRGLIQLTGRENYMNADAALGVDFVRNPDLLLLPDNAALVSGWYWDRRNLNSFADYEDFVGITLRVAGGLQSHESRLRYYEIAKSVMI